MTNPRITRLTIWAMADDKITWFLMSGADAQQTENILELFQRIKGRPATAEERAELASRAEKAHLIDRSNAL